MAMLASSLPEGPRHLDAAAYPYSLIWINGRHVSVEKIVEGKESPGTAFEESTFNFLREWLLGAETFVMNTSGSTGEPKGITISRSQMLQSARRTAEKIKLQKNSTALLCIDSKYIGGKMMLVRSLMLGMKIMAIDPCANPLARIPVDKCVQFTAVVPYQVHAILESKHPHLLNNLDKVLIGGAPLDETTRAKLDSYLCECYETYAMTETVSHVALRLANTQGKQPYFETLPGVDISLDTRGCIVINAEYLDRPVVTNDLVEITGERTFTWLGRWDSIINTGGVKVVPEKVEQQLASIFRQNDFGHRFFIAALPDEKLGSKVVLIVEGVQFSSEILNRSLQELKSALSPYEIPKEVYAIPAFINTPTQKIDRIQTLAGVTMISSIR